MKRSIFTFCCILFLSGTLSAQITLTASNMGLDALIGNVTLNKVANPAAAPQFIGQQNATWDLTNLYYSTPAIYSPRFTSPIGGFSFADSSFKLNFKNAGSFTVEGIYEAVTQGVSLYRLNIDADTLAHQKPSGHNDLIAIQSQSPYLSSSASILPLPLTYNTPIPANNYNYTVQFAIIDSALNIIGEPGSIYSTVNDASSVIGYGKLRINRTDTNGGTHTLVKSGYYNVLQVQKTKTQIDTYAIATPSHLYDSLGFHSLTTIDTSSVIDTATRFDTVNHVYVLDTLSYIDSVLHIDTVQHITETIVISGQDTTITHDTTYSLVPTYSYFTTSYFYTYDTFTHYYVTDTTKTYEEMFYRRGTITPLVHVVFTDATFHTPSSIMVNTDNLSQFDEGVDDVADKYDINVYPNPASNRNIYLDIGAAGGGKWSYEVINMSGQVIATDNIRQSGGKIHQQLTLPDVAAGVYFVRVNNNGKQATVKPLEIIK